MKTRQRPGELRERIAREAARIMVAGGFRDYQAAKRKAAARLGAHHRGQLPSNPEIEAALLEHQRLFDPLDHPVRLRAMREGARRELVRLACFEPCLVGEVLRGTADANSLVTLHLFTEPSENVGLRLDELGIRFDLVDRRFRFAPETYRQVPGYRYVCDEIPIELAVFPRDGRRQSPLSPVDGRPMQRADLNQLARLLESAATSRGR